MERIPKYQWQYYPMPLPIQEPDSNLREWVDAHQDVYDQTDDDLQSIIDSKHVSSAQSRELDEKGKMLGVLAKRKGRGDEEYRQFLYGLNGTFNGRGTRSGLRFAVGTGILAEDPQEDIQIIEHFDDKEYSLVISDWQGHNVKTIYDLAQLSDPVGVNLRKPVEYRSDPCKVRADTYEVRAGLTIETPPHPVGVTTPNSATTKKRSDGFGSGRLDGDDPFGPPGDDIDAGTFESGTLAGWENEHPSFGLAEDRVLDGRFSGHIEDLSGNTNMIAERRFTKGQNPNQIKFSYNESSDSNGSGLRVVDSEGNDVLGVSTDNPQFEVIDANGNEEVEDSFVENYDEWVSVEILIDWEGDWFNVSWERESGDSFDVFNRPLINSTDVKSLQLWSYSGGNWGEQDVDVWFDEVTVGTVEREGSYNDGVYNEGRYNQ